MGHQMKKLPWNVYVSYNYNTQIFHPANMLVEASHIKNVKMADTFHQSKTAYIYQGGKKII